MVHALISFIHGYFGNEVVINKNSLILKRQTRVEDGDPDSGAGDPHLPEDVRLQHGGDLPGDGAQEATALVSPGRVPPAAKGQAAPAFSHPEI